MFGRTTPEKAGISSEKVLEFFKTIDVANLNTHSVIMAKGNDIFAESYYKPFHKDYLHRMYSISKSFIAIAVGLAYTEGLLSLEDKVMDYFPELKEDNPNDFAADVTIRDMLTMSTNCCGHFPWYQNCESRLRAYFSMKVSNKLTGTLFFYDSIGSYILNCIVEKLTGKEFLEYLKEKVLLELGFSKESYTLYAPGGYTIGDSGVMCTSRDLLLFTRFVAQYGEWNGKQYIDREFMKQAVTKQVHNNIINGVNYYGSHGYGYLIWCMPDDGFAFIGMGDQLAIYDRNTDFTFIITSDNQADSATARPIIFHEVYKTLIHNFAKEQLPENKEAYALLSEYMDSRVLTYQKGKYDSAFSEKINSVKYNLSENSMNIASFSIKLEKESGIFSFEKDGIKYEFPFGMGKNIFGKFPENRRQLLSMGDIGEGHYECATSAAWMMENHLVIKTQIIDTYFGSLNIHFVFKDDNVQLLMKKSGQYILDGFEGYANGKKA